MGKFEQLVEKWREDAELSTVKPAPAPEFVPLASHWTVTGHERDADMRAYAAIPSPYQGPREPS